MRVMLRQMTLFNGNEVTCKGCGVSLRRLFTFFEMSQELDCVIAPVVGNAGSAVEGVRVSGKGYIITVNIREAKFGKKEALCPKFL